MDEKKDSFWKKFIKFFFTSGIGFIMDFVTYTILTQLMNFEVLYANCISSIIGAVFVFFVSTHKIFEKGKGILPMPAKYAVYIVYQLLLIFLVSKLGEFINELIITYINVDLILQYSKLVCKVLITPVIMVCNFLVVRFIAEKI
ncbi:MAG: GtrA family protein [Oscillospiraceae bacterium]|nr:GtrA family protein [Oscillospiraceae bacterium]